MRKLESALAIRWLICSLVILFSCCCPLHARETTHYFEVSDGKPTENFVIALSNRQKIETARNIASGIISDRIHVSGKIIKKRARYNPNWNFHLDPKSITFVTFASTTCGRHMNTSDIQANLDLVGKPGSPLAAGFWCPLGSRVTAEVSRP
jgi:hypothetical protein